MTFDDFCKHYSVTIKANDLKALTPTEIVKDVRRFIPKYSSNPNGKNYALYCKNQLIRYSSWRNLDQWLIDNNDPKYWIKKWADFLQKTSSNDIKYKQTWQKDLDAAEIVLQQLESGIIDVDVPWEEDEYLSLNIALFIVRLDILFP